MDKNLQDIEDLFYSNLEGNEEMPSEKVWDAVDKRLDKETVISIKRKYTNLKRLSAVLLLLLISFVIFELNNTNNNNGIAGKSYNVAGNKPGAVNYDTNSGERPVENISAVIKPATNNDKKENTTGDILLQDADNMPAPQQNNIKGPLNQKQPASNNITQVQIAGEDILKDQSVGSYTSGRRKKQTTKPVYKVTIKNAIAAGDDELARLIEKNKSGNIGTSKITIPESNFTENQLDVFTTARKKKGTAKPAYKVTIKNATASADDEMAVDVSKGNTGKKEDNVTDNIKPDKKDAMNTKKVSEPASLAKLKLTDSSVNAVAKTDKKKLGKPSRFSFSPFFSPDIAWYRLQDNKIGNSNENASAFEREEKHEFSYTYGLLTDYKINKHWGLQSGVTLSNTNIIIEPKTIYAQPDNAGNVKYRINTSSGYGYVLPAFSSSPVIGDSLYAFTSTHSLQYIGIPLALTYNITKGKFKFNVLAGFSANILTRAKLETDVEKGFNNSLETVNNIEGLKKMYISGLVGVGVDYKLTRKTSLTFAPTMRFALNSINKDATVKSYPMSMGFVAGLKIGL